MIYAKRGRSNEGLWSNSFAQAEFARIRMSKRRFLGQFAYRLDIRIGRVAGDAGAVEDSVAMGVEAHLVIERRKHFLKLDRARRFCWSSRFSVLRTAR